MNFRSDLAQWQFKRLKTTYSEVSESARFINKDGVPSKLSANTIWRLCSGKVAADPSAQTIKVLFKALKLKPEYALNFGLKKSEFHLAVTNGGNNAG